MKISPSDRLICFLYHCGFARIAEKMLWLLKGSVYSALVQWRDHGGMVWMLNPSIAIDRALLVNGCHDPEIAAIISAEIKAGDVFWDIGANIGCLSLPIARQHKGVRLVAFEPSPAAANQFVLNAAINNIQAELVSAPLADCSRAECLHLKLSRNSGQNSLRPWENVKYDTKMHVLCDSGDNLFRIMGLPEPDVIKLDVEQFEEEVLRGLNGILSGSKLRLIVFECMSARSPERFQSINSLLEGAGFCVEAIPPAPGKPVENYVARRSVP